MAIRRLVASYPSSEMGTRRITGNHVSVPKTAGSRWNRLKARDAGEIEIGDLHRGELHLPIFVGDGVGGSGEGFHIAERTKWTLVPAEVHERSRDLAVF